MKGKIVIAGSLLMFFLYAVAIHSSASAVDTGGCDCTGDLNGEDSASGLIVPSQSSAVEVTNAPTSVCINEWFRVDASGGYDCDIVKGAGSYCPDCDGGTLPTCSGGEELAHNDTNANVAYLWTITGHQAAIYPGEDREPDCPDCEDGFNFNTNPFIWIQAPAQAGEISVKAERDPASAYDDGVFPASTAVTIDVVVPTDKDLDFYANGNYSEATVNSLITNANDVILNVDDDGPTLWTDTNANCQIDSGDEESGWADTVICRKLVKKSYSANACTVSNWSGRQVQDADANLYTVVDCDVVFGQDGWFTTTGKIVVTEGRLITVDEHHTNPPTVHFSGGWATCSGSYLILKNTGGSSLVHELGHNQNLGHVDLSNNDDEYKKNVMSYGASRTYVSERALTLDVNAGCTGTDQDTAYGAMANP